MASTPSVQGTASPSPFPDDSCTTSPAPLTLSESRDATPAPKAAPKKRKAWGQPLPEPTTNLPPRKRAKTAAEKEQRRIERIKRNRAAAQTSRERKRQEFEAIQIGKQQAEAENESLKLRLSAAEAQINFLKAQLKDFAPSLPNIQNLPPTTFQPGESILSHNASPTLTPSLFSREEETSLKHEDSDQQIMSLLSVPPNDNAGQHPLSPSSISEGRCKDDSELTSNVTQLPAVGLCDQQCPLENSQTSPLQTAFNLRVMQYVLMMIQLPLQIWITPLFQTVHSLKNRSSILNPSWFHQTMILFLTTLPTSNPSVTKALTFRCKEFQTLLKCNPALARPIKDATIERMQQLEWNFKGVQGRVERKNVRLEWNLMGAILWSIDEVWGESGLLSTLGDRNMVAPVIKVSTKYRRSRVRHEKLRTQALGRHMGRRLQ
ncbi:MAG: hypothetical protein M1834_005039 [Cirrosporium novae-zelandiae]|nr:MAG: hypothetical protein M1834_005039 [Cirrosporium novae-zelandiae]